VPYLLRLWFGVSEQVGRRAYALSGVGLMIFKYGVEALAIWLFCSAAYLPWQFFNPVLSMRTEMLQAGPQWVGWALVAWSLPFLWIAMSMSVRRAADAGASPWLGLLVFVPLINLLFMVAMSLLPTTANQRWLPQNRPASGEERAKSAVFALGVSLMIGAVMIVVSVSLLASYGGSLFLGTPLLMGATAGYFYNRKSSRGYLASVGLGLAAVSCGGLALLLFALEGLICVAMAVPLLLPLGALGGLMGKAIADSSRRPAHELMAAIIVLPMLAIAESRLFSTTEYEVMTAIEIDAPSEVVWEHVIDFPDLPPPSQWYFRTGIACPERARIVGEGVGATRYCEFTTGTFVEPITVWEPARRLAFDVTEQPAPMFELSPYRHVHPPHLDGYLRSNRGEFLLIAMPGGRTRLEGRTWYRFNMFPQSYWTLWSHLFIHRIHERVLLHVKQFAEDQAA
jgi:uncharacterized membrane protein YhaH (DUF805 family)